MKTASKTEIGCASNDGHFSGPVPLDVPIRFFAAGPCGSCGNPATYALEFWEDTPNPDVATVVNLSAGSPDLPGNTQRALLPADS